MLLNRNTRAAIIIIITVISFTASVLWFSQSDSTNFDEKQQLTVLVSFHPLYEFTNEISKERIHVSTIVPSGIEPHDWEPTIQDLQKIQNADMIIINGAGFETWFNDFIASNPNIMVVDTSKGIDLVERHDNRQNVIHEDNESRKDPHIWLNPVLAKVQVQNIANGLMKLDPQNAQYYQDNANTYNTKLDMLDKKIRNEFSDCSKKDFIAFHDAFSYFAKEYNLNQHIIVGIDPHAEPTAITLQQIIENAKNLDLNIIFTEEAVNPRISEVIADEIGGKVLILSPIEVVDENADYIQKMEQNMLNLKEELCS